MHFHTAMLILDGKYTKTDISAIIITAIITADVFLWPWLQLTWNSIGKARQGSYM